MIYEKKIRDMKVQEALDVIRRTHKPVWMTWLSFLKDTLERGKNRLPMYMLPGPHTVFIVSYILLFRLSV